MGHRKDGVRGDPDRYLELRRGIYYYRRRVPGELAHLDERGENIRHSLKTVDLAKARAIRDELEAADDEFWAALVHDTPRDDATVRYQAAVRRAKAFGFAYRPSAELAAKASTTELVGRVEAAFDAPNRGAVLPAVVGGLEPPQVRLMDALDTYFKKIAPQQLAGKSEGQRHKWKIGKQRAVEAFIEIVGDIAITDITREHGRKVFDHFMGRIAPLNGKEGNSASLGNRRIGDLRGLYRDYFDYLGEHDRKNPFEGLSFIDKTRLARKRPPFPLEWITGRLLKPGALAGLNDEARGIFLVVADTGARPSEIANLTPEQIALEDKVPHLRIEPRSDPGDPREIKTASSIRLVPLVGLALAVMKRHKAGFPRYKDKEASLSTGLNKFLRENHLLPTDAHSVYSLRHSFEDRMKEAKIDEEMRRLLMGHSIDRPAYGEGGSLALRREAMLKVTLPFDPAIV